MYTNKNEKFLTLYLEILSLVQQKSIIFVYHKNVPHYINVKCDKPHEIYISCDLKKKNHRHWMMMWKQAARYQTKNWHFCKIYQQFLKTNECLQERMFMTNNSF